MDATAISLTGVSKRFGAVTALEDVTLDIERGEVFGLLGPNGAGKSTLIDLLFGYKFPDGGDVRVLGSQPATEPIGVRRDTGLLPEADTLFPSWTGREHVEFVCEASGAADDPQSVLETVGVADAADRPVEGYSEGMRQRLALGIALVGSPELLVLDEPAAGLDPAGIATLRDVICDRRDAGCTVLLSSHRLPQVEAVADRVGILVEGRLEDVASVDEIARRLPSAVTASLSDPPAESALERIAGRDEVSSVRFDAGRVRILCADDATRDVLDDLEAAGHRPTDVEIQRDALEDYVLSVTDEEAPADAPG